MKRPVLAVLACACLLAAPAVSSAQTWVPFGSAFWIGTGQAGSFVLFTSSEPTICPSGCDPFIYGGIELTGGPAKPSDIQALSFDYKPSATGASGGSPRLVLQFSDGGDAQLRPLDWVADTWATVNGLEGANWDSTGGTCGYRYDVDWATSVGCHSNATITAIFMVNDSGWLYSYEAVELKAVNVNGIKFGPTKETCRKGGFAALGFRNQGACIASFADQQ